MIAIAVVASLLGCSSRVHTPYVPGSAPALIHPIAATGTEFDYLAHGYPAGTLEAFEGDAGDYWTWSLQMPSAGAAGHGRAPVMARYDEGKAAGAKPLVIVLPVWGVSAYPSETIAASLREQGEGAINVLQVDGDQMLFDWVALGDARSEAELQLLLALMNRKSVV